MRDARRKADGARQAGARRLRPRPARARGARARGPLQRGAAGPDAGLCAAAHQGRIPPLRAGPREPRDDGGGAGDAAHPHGAGRRLDGPDGTCPEAWASWQPARRRSATASTFAASLELAKEGKLELRQGETFAPIQVRKADRPGGGPWRIGRHGRRRPESPAEDAARQPVRGAAAGRAGAHGRGGSVRLRRAGERWPS